MQRTLTGDIRVNLTGNIYSKGHKHAGIIEHISCDGEEYIMHFSVKDSKYTPPQAIQLSFLRYPGVILNLTCNVICFSRSEPKDEKLTMAMKVLNTSQQFIEFIDTL